MAEYARAGAQDDCVKNWSAFGFAKFGESAPFRSPEQKWCWADFWLLKHCVNFVNDEPRLFEVGEPEALDLLIAPAVLVRMEHPAEDCDGFAMLTASLLQIQGVKCYFVTIACDPSDRERWSHVFTMAELQDGTRIPIDASKGMFPGWMVPRKHIFKWQAWDMDGKPVSVGTPELKAKLQGYRRRGVGDEYVDPGMVELGTPSISTPPFVPDRSLSPGVSADQWAKIISAATSGALNIYRQTQSPGLVPGTGLVYDPGSGRFLPSSGYGALLGGSNIGGSISSWILPIGGLLLAAVLLPRLMGGGK